MKTFGIGIENNHQKTSDLGPNVLSFWSPHRTKIDPKIDPKSDTKFTCILTLIFDRFWSIWGAKMGRPGGQQRANEPTFSIKIGLGSSRPTQDRPRPPQIPPRPPPRSILGPILERFPWIFDQISILWDPF